MTPTVAITASRTQVSARIAARGRDRQRVARYANGVAEQKGLGIRFQAIVPQQMIGGTGVGDVGASARALEATS